MIMLQCFVLRVPGLNPEGEHVSKRVLAAVTLRTTCWCCAVSRPSLVQQGAAVQVWS
jgi:hypothetical protein